MFLSIIIPYYNLPHALLERCVQSIITQGIPDNEYEIIIVDDGSENAPTWITQISANINLIINKHSGLGGARNKGISVAKGEYIIFVDADDYLFNNCEILSCINKLKQERPQILRYNYAVKQEYKEKTIKGRKNIKFSNTISGATYMYRKNLFGSACIYFFKRELSTKKGIIFTENIFHEDEEFSTKLHYHAQTLIDSNATLYCYCIRKDSITANESKEFEKQRISDFIHIIERLHNFAKENNEKSNIIQARAIAHKLDMLIVDAILNMMYAGMSAKEIIGQCKKSFEPISLYPLRKAGYSLKYRIFRKMANNLFGMMLLRMILPSRKPAKK